MILEQKKFEKNFAKKICETNTEFLKKKKTKKKIFFSIYIKRFFGQTFTERLRSKFVSRKPYKVLDSPGV